MTHTTTLTESETNQPTILRLRGEEEDIPAIRYPRYLPVWEKTTTVPPLEEIKGYVDPGSRGTPDKRHLLAPGAQAKLLTPELGTEIRGVQLSSLTKEGLDDLALLAAERGVLVFRGQDWKNIPIEQQAQTVKHFGRLHVHPTEAHPEGYPSFRVVYRDPLDPTITANLRYGNTNRPSPISSTLFHVDHSAELQPPGVTFFWALEIPETGGDTIFSSQSAAYEALSDDFKQRLEGLRVIHDNTAQIENSRKAGGPVRYEPVIVEHPLVRTHPVTRRKSIFIHGFSQRIVGWKKEESDMLLTFLNDIIVKSVDFQVRASYEPDTVVVWDNRILSHSAIHDWKGSERRHMIRVAAHADTPR